jgi:hypothetical protein
LAIPCFWNRCCVPGSLCSSKRRGSAAPAQYAAVASPAKDDVGNALPLLQIDETVIAVQ